ncbi:hypothetical protein [Streptomyces telluris]|uniref:Uncharacterized protein n=1 Tax=Streptomyces telluris TaxID=2720021 RepID=A0A9X2LQ48_9ACTN|nr:hypothetical protein [Streptomyces telluris]MCQ8775072.1 hypothetical protein [Streptomyces telluris]
MRLRAWATGIVALASLGIALAIMLALAENVGTATSTGPGSWMKPSSTHGGRWCSDHIGSPAWGSAGIAEAGLDPYPIARREQQRRAVLVQIIERHRATAIPASPARKKTP